MRRDRKNVTLFKAIHPRCVYSQNEQTTNKKITYIVETSTATCFRNIDKHHRAVQKKKEKVVIHNCRI